MVGIKKIKASVDCAPNMDSDMSTRATTNLNRKKLEHSSLHHSIPFVPRLVFPIHSSRKLRHFIHGGSKVCFEARFKVAKIYPLPLLFLYAGYFQFHFYPRRKVSM
ncbi:hypothetical protein AVEN_74233-1 [Araneus ventricosus]|uniref:Uncharacterized protein n=1 Tax=Araneus ventricosus TaxID=182803 RepID=A0A4Y2EUE6_ARAVE|nr:hypothetical protein AVEN_74233-1 [Araneus ventricosus]